jgi:hypothetical protein
MEGRKNEKEEIGKKGGEIKR